MTLRDALVHSKNVITVDLAMQLNIGRVMNFAAKAGLPKVEHAYPSMALGTAEATPLQVASAYTTFANLGDRVSPLPITQVTTGDGRVVASPTAEKKSIVRPDVAYIMVLAEDVAELTLKVDKESGAYNLTDREDAEFCEIEQAISDSCGRLIRWSISPTILKGICRTGDLFSLRLNRDLYTKLMSSLTYSSELAVKNLGWEPRPCLDFIREGGLSEQPGEAITDV